jgi:hypothetical protein
LPRPAHIRVRFHEPIDPRQYRGPSEAESIAAILVEWRRRVERSLRPGVKADDRLSSVYFTRAPRPRLHEISLACVVSAMLVWGGAPMSYQLIPVAYLLYLLLDRAILPQRRITKVLRNTSPLSLMLLLGPRLLSLAHLPPVPAGQALDAVLLGALLPYFYERSSVAMGFMRGLVLAASLEVGALVLAPTGLGPHVALPLFAAGFAFFNRTVLWAYASPLLALYALGATRFVGGREELLIHVAVGLVALLLVRVKPYHRRSSVARPESGLAPGG